MAHRTRAPCQGARGYHPQDTRSEAIFASFFCGISEVNRVWRSDFVVTPGQIIPGGPSAARGIHGVTRRGEGGSSALDIIVPEPSAYSWNRSQPVGAIDGNSRDHGTRVRSLNSLRPPAGKIRLLLTTRRSVVSLNLEQSYRFSLEARRSASPAVLWCIPHRQSGALAIARWAGSSDGHARSGVNATGHAAQRSF